MGYIKAFILELLSSQCFHADERFWIFALRASVLGLITSMVLDGRRNICTVKSARSFLHAEFKTRILTPLQANNEKCESRSTLET